MVETLHSLGVFGMTAVIWIIQLLAYPGFLNIDPEKWTEHHRHHTKNITFIVCPLMFCQITCAGILCWQEQSLIHLTHLTLAALTWISTLLLFAPLHLTLGHTNDPALIKKLITRNWLRTILWSAGSLLLISESINY